MSQEDEVRSIAYKLWEEEGRPQGHDVEHWLKAEAIWQAQPGQASESAQSESTERPARSGRRSAKK